MANQDTAKKKVISSLIWKFFERIGYQGVNFIVQIVLARLLLPEDYGIISLLIVFVNIANAIIQNGFNTALIQKKEVDEIDISSAFFVTLILSIFLYVVLYLSAPSISEFYRMPKMIPVLRVLALLLPLGAVNSIQIAILSRNLQFYKLLISNMSAVICSGTSGIILAYMGAGVWALVVQQLLFNLISCIVLWFVVKWRPSLRFSIQSIKTLFSFGWKMLVSRLINLIYGDIYSLVIGRVFSANALGYYNRGKQFSYTIIMSIDGAIQSVMLPAYSREQENKKVLKSMTRRSIVTSSYVVFPVMMGLGVVARPLVSLLLTDKWLGCVPFLQINCFIYALYPIHSANLQVICAMGKSEVYLKLEVIKKILGVAIMFCTLPFGIYWFTFGGVITGLLSTVINAFPNIEYLDYSIAEQWKDIFPSFILSIVMGAIVYPIQFLPINNLFILFIQIIVGVIIYVGASVVFRLECFYYLKNTILDMIRGKKKV